MKQLITAIFLLALTNVAYAGCDNQYCGQGLGFQEFPSGGFSQKVVRSHHHHRHHRHRAIAHKEKSPKAVQVANIGNEPIGEPPRASSGLLATAKSYLGSNPTGWRHLWCAHFIAMIAPKAAEALKHMGLNPNWARDYAKLPGAKSHGDIGDIVVLTRGRGGHIGVLAGYSNGNPIVVSGNHGRVVGTGTYSKHRVLAYVTI